MNGKILVSIIVPVYNVEGYLIRAINSAQFQTYSNIEIILVDDGSTDTSKSLCEKIAEIDTRISVIHQENAGPSSARNTGILAAKGQYIFFLDADDTIEPDTIESMLQIMLDKDCDLVVCGIKQIFIDENGDTSSKRDLWLDRAGFYNNLELLIKLRSGNFAEGTNASSVWNKLYKKRYFDHEENLFPVDMKYCEDVYFLIDFLKKCSRIYYIKESLYNYYSYNIKTRKSLMNSFKGNRFEIYKKLYLKIYNTINGNVSREILEQCKHDFADRVILACAMICRGDAPHAKKEMVEKLDGIVNDEAVIDAMKSYNRKANNNWTNSWTMPLLIRQKKIEYLMYFANKIARKRFT